MKFIQIITILCLASCANQPREHAQAEIKSLGSASIENLKQMAHLSEKMLHTKTPNEERAIIKQLEIADHQFATNLEKLAAHGKRNKQAVLEAIKLIKSQGFSNSAASFALRQLEQSVTQQ